MRLLICLLISLTALQAADAPMTNPDAGVRLKELCFIEGVRDNQLNGVGVVVGLEGTGDDKDAVLKAMSTYLKRNHIQVDRTGRDVKGKNIALVVVTAKLPPFKKSGSRIPCTVSAIGDAKSLKGGVLLQTLLTGYDGKVYASAQGSLSIGGFGKATSGLANTGQDHQNIETTALLAEGAIVEHEVPMEMIFRDQLRLSLNEPDFTNAARVASVLAETFGDDRVTAQDGSTVVLRFPETPSQGELITTIASIENLRVSPDTIARVVINERTGTVVVGAKVRIAPVAVSHGGLSLQVRSNTIERQDPDGKRPPEVITTWEHPATQERLNRPPKGMVVDRETIPGSISVMDGATVEEISSALNALGARPRDMVAIFQAIHRAGALHAELVIM